MAARSRNLLTVSPASLNLLRECPRCYWLTARGNLPRPVGLFPGLPGALDRFIKAMCQPYHGSSELPPFLANIGLVGRLVDPRVPPWTDVVNGIQVSGHLDECLEIPGIGFGPLDHKSRATSPKGINPAYRLQLDVYTLMLEHHTGSVLPQGYLIYYIPQNEDNSSELFACSVEMRFSVEMRQIDTSPTRALNIAMRARQVFDLPDPPGPSSDCAYCQWGISWSLITKQ